MIASPLAGSLTLKVLEFYYWPTLNQASGFHLIYLLKIVIKICFSQESILFYNLSSSFLIVMFLSSVLFITVSKELKIDYLFRFFSFFFQQFQKIFGIFSQNFFQQRKRAKRVLCDSDKTSNYQIVC